MIISYFAIIIEDHGSPFGTIVNRPLRKIFCIRVSCAGEIDPCLAHSISKLKRVFPTSGHGSVDICIVEHEWYFHAMCASEDAVKHRRFPGKHICVYRSSALTCLDHSLFNGAWTEGKVCIYQVFSLVIRICLFKQTEEFFCLLSVFCPEIFNCSRLVYSTELRNVCAHAELVDSRAYHHRNIL